MLPIQILLYDSPDGLKTEEEVEKKTEICNNYQDDDDDGKKPDCLDSDCKDDKFCKSRKACPSVSRVLRLAKSNALIKASLLKQSKGAISAVQPNYELVYNDQRFSQLYKCMLEGIPAIKCGIIKCPECKVEEPEKEKEIVIKSKERHARYVYRHYLGVDIKVGEEACNDGVDNDLDGAVDRRDSDCAPAELPKPKPAPVRIVKKGNLGVVTGR